MKKAFLLLLFRLKKRAGVQPPTPPFNAWLDHNNLPVLDHNGDFILL